MVKGLDVFHKYFAEYTDQYVLIGGAACDISFGKSEISFRATRDLDIVLIVEAMTKEFGQRFWQFIEDGEYRNKSKSNGTPQFYRFDKPQKAGYPAMLELFARSDQIIDENMLLASVHIDAAVASLSAILLNDAYYETLLAGRDIIGGISVLRPTWLIPFKAKAWLDMNRKSEQGEHVDSRDIKKHRNDIIRIVSELVLEPCTLPEIVQKDMRAFNNSLHVSNEELKNLGIIGVYEADIKQAIKDTYRL